MDTDNWILKGKKLITIKKQRLKIQRVDSQKYNIKKKKQSKITKIIKIYMKFALKIGSFFAR